ncbi:MAG: response regulator transcription factor [Firmicutes bacterium]|nr:response regulator transcription factor [Bacillota bacterium]
MDRIRVLIADDHALLRQGLCRILELEGDIEVVAQAADGDEAVALTKEIRPDVVLMDINMPGLNGLEATQMIKDAAPDTRILVLTIHSDDEYVFQVLQAGASGYVLKDVDPANLAEAIRTVNKGHAYLRSPLLEKVLEEFGRLSQAQTETAAAVEWQSNGRSSSVLPSPARSRDDEGRSLLDRLTFREREILECIVGGQSNKEIAATLMISEKTVKNHVSNILRKLELADRTQAAIYALRRGVTGRRLDT